ncbi:MAG: PD-(D/E)XK nuclease family protein [Oceanicoccus sp.]
MSSLISLFDVQPLWEPLISGQLILTPNQRLASRIRSAFAIACSEAGENVVFTPAVFSINQWIDQCWLDLLMGADGLAMDVTVLSANQEQALWERIVADSSYGPALLRPSATAQQAITAFNTLVNWRQDVRSAGLRTTLLADEDASALMIWVDQFIDLCESNRWLASVQIPERLLIAFQHGSLSPCGDILGVGFEDIAPLHQALLDAAGNFTHDRHQHVLGKVRTVVCDTPEQELQAAAVWAKQAIKNDPAATVAIVVPDLTAQRHVVQRIIQEVFEPGYNEPRDSERSDDPGTDSSLSAPRNLSFNFSAGYPLTDAPVIGAALDALALGFVTIDSETAVRICQSPFYCLSDDDIESCSQLISRVFAEKAFELPTAKLRHLATRVIDKKQADVNDQPAWIFSEALQNIATLTRDHAIRKPRRAGEWLLLLQDILSAVGWPGQRRLDSIEFQQVSQWPQLIESLQMLDEVLPPMSFSEMVGQLHSIAARQVFQPQTADSSLQVLGTLEAAGLRFSHLWLTSMSDQSWPPSPSPNPLLPFHLQRQQGMPHASAERELEYARSLTDRFVHSADFMVASSLSVIDDNPAVVSALFTAFPQIKLNELLGRSLSALLPLVEIRRRFQESAVTEEFLSGDAPVLQAEELVRGGATLFASQSACPFRAFMSHRLGVRALPAAEIGLNAADRGSLLHRACELIWQKLKSQQALLALDDAGQMSLCEETSQYVVRELDQRGSLHLGSRYQQLECQRLTLLLNTWLNFERDRSDFIVRETEARKVFQHGHLKLETRIDRIDQLADGSLAVIDYKTSKTSIARWWGDRPEEPQLPLYGMLVELAGDAVSGVGFAELRIEGCALKGMGDETSPEPLLQWQDKVKNEAAVLNWEQLKRHWEKVLTALASDFVAGKSAVDPRNPPQTCQYCDFSSVCRINHQQVGGL